MCVCVCVCVCVRLAERWLVCLQRPVGGDVAIGHPPKFKPLCRADTEEGADDAGKNRGLAESGAVSMIRETPVCEPRTTKK